MRQHRRFQLAALSTRIGLLARIARSPVEHDGVIDGGPGHQVAIGDVMHAVRTSAAMDTKFSKVNERPLSAESVVDRPACEWLQPV